MYLALFSDSICSVEGSFGGVSSRYGCSDSSLSSRGTPCNVKNTNNPQHASPEISATRSSHSFHKFTVHRSSSTGRNYATPPLCVPLEELCNTYNSPHRSLCLAFEQHHVSYSWYAQLVAQRLVCRSQLKEVLVARLAPQELHGAATCNQGKERTSPGGCEARGPHT